MKFDLICVDMFQTLVDVNARVPFIWKKILADKYSEPLAVNCARSVSRNVFSEFQLMAASNKDFINLRTMFKPFFHRVIEEMNVSCDIEMAINIFLEEHTRAVPYDDVEDFFRVLNNVVPICLVTDADVDMVAPIVKRYPFDKVYISENVKSYKNEPQSRIFKEVLKQYAIDPEKVLHIGDSYSDIIGAYRVGMKTCWINREAAVWKGYPVPDYEINSLVEVIKILNSCINILK